MALIKREILTSREVLHAKSVLVLQKIRFLLAQNVSLSEKKKKKNWHSMFVTIFQVSVDEGKGK